MEVEVIFPALEWETLQDHLFGQSDAGPPQRCDEQMAFLLAAPNASIRSCRLTIREVVPGRAPDLAYQSPTGIAPTGESVAEILTRCRREGWSLIEVHSHPFSHGDSTTFSTIDWANDRAKMPAVSILLPEQSLHATMVVGRTSLDAHFYDRGSAIIQPVQRISILGAHDTEQWLTYLTPTQALRSGEDSSVENRYARQVPILGSGTQRLLAKSELVIVGLGGLGSMVALEFAHLGVGRLVLIDPDRVESSNLNRLLGAAEGDIGRPKVEVCASQVRAISPRCDVIPIAASILDEKALQAAKSADILVGCVDSHGARLVLNQLAVQYLIPLIDGGTGVRLDSQGCVTHAGGQIQVVLPGLGCLACRGFIDARQAALDLAPAHVRQREHEHGYGTGEAVPSVIFLNGVVASLQVSEAVKLLSGTVGVKPYSPMSAIIFYNLLSQSMMRATATASDNCPVCGLDGVSGLADLSPLHMADTLPVSQSALSISSTSGARSDAKAPRRS
jgi:molybdopterin-synthase adenylyltransferase